VYLFCNRNLLKN